MHYLILHSFRTTAFSFCFVISFFPILVFTLKQMSYKAAVVEYAPKREISYLPRQILLENTNQYVVFIKQAADEKADIIVFPQYGLTTIDVIYKLPVHLEAYSIEIPSVRENEKLYPCNGSSDNYHQVLTKLSCAAKNGTIYVVVNILEKEALINGSAAFQFYNTNIVFDRTGTIIKKYRKINLLKEKYFIRGQEEVSFTTDFGVKFGFLICEDILYEKPSSKLLENFQNVTDIIYSTAWNSETPFLHGLSVQHGYVKANKINLLTACLNDADSNSTGSGIFFANGTIADTFISAVSKTRLLIQNIPENNIRDDAGICQEEYSGSSNQFKFEETFPEIIDIRTAFEDLQYYSCESLDFSKKNVEGCSKDNRFCCFNITVDSTSNLESDYTYKLVSFYGSRYLGPEPLSHNITVSVCALVACLNSTSTTCGLRNTYAPKLKFNKISIKTKLEQHYVQPTTLKYNMLPANDYIFCKRNFSNNLVEYFVNTTNSQESLLTFGIFGRVFANDNRSVGRIPLNEYFDNKSEDTKVYIIIALVLIIITIIVVFVIYRYIYKRNRLVVSPREYLTMTRMN